VTEVTALSNDVWAIRAWSKSRPVGSCFAPWPTGLHEPWLLLAQALQALPGQACLGLDWRSRRKFAMCKCRC